MTYRQRWDQIDNMNQSNTFLVLDFLEKEGLDPDTVLSDDFADIWKENDNIDDVIQLLRRNTQSRS